MLAVAGTADPLVPYGGGPIGLRRRGAARSPRSDPASAPRGVAAPIEDVARDWAAANGCPPEPRIEIVTTGAVDPTGPTDPPAPRTTSHPDPRTALPVTRLSWTAPDRLPVVVDRVEGGGHAWPGGAAYLPGRVIGRVAANLDTSAVAVDFVARHA